MPWKQNEAELARGFADLRYAPRGQTSWDCTLAALAYGVRMDLPGRTPDLNRWASCHGLPASERYARIEQPLVLWHGTSRQHAIQDIPERALDSSATQFERTATVEQLRVARVQPVDCAAQVEAFADQQRLHREVGEVRRGEQFGRPTD